MNGLARVFWAAAGTGLRMLARLPLGCGDALLRAAAACERRAGKSRERLGDRRGAETLDFTFSRDANDVQLGQGQAYTATLGRFPDGRLAEVFIDSHKLSSVLTDDARDTALIVSLALQHGMPIGTLGHSVSRFSDGRPCTLAGRLADLLLDHQMPKP